MKLRYVLGLSLLAATVAFTSCSKDEKKDDNKKKEQKDNKEEQKAPIDRRDCREGDVYGRRQSSSCYSSKQGEW